MQVVQVLSHIKTRLQAIPQPELPVSELAAILVEPDRSAYAYSFAFMFIGKCVAASCGPCGREGDVSRCMHALLHTEIGFVAATREEQAATLSQILIVLPKFPAAQQEVFFRVFLRALPLTSSTVWPGSDGDSNRDASSEGVDILLDFLLDVVLFEFSGSGSSSQAAGITQNGPATAEATLYGLMTPRVERLSRCNVAKRQRDELYALQLLTFGFIKELAVPTRFKLLHYVAGSASYHHAVKAFCDDQLARVIKYEDVEVEDLDTMRSLMSLTLGSQVAQSTGPFAGRDALLLSNRTRAADLSILQALALLSASKTATNAMPMMLQLLCQLMFATESSRAQNMANKVKLGGVRLCQWVFLHCDEVYIQGFLGPVLFPTFMRLLMDPHFDSEASSLEFARDFRQGIYECVALLSTRATNIVAGSEQAFQVLLVRSLTEEGNRTGAGAAALNAFSSLAAAYCSANAPTAVRASVTQELIELMNGSKLFDTTQNYVRVRAAIGTWCDALLATSSVHEADDSLAIRFALLRFASDADEQTRQQASKALYKSPLPQLSSLSRYLQLKFKHKDLKKSMRDDATVEKCLEFCLTVFQSPSSKSIDESDDDDRRLVIEYVALTLVNPPSSSPRLCEVAAASLVKMAATDATLVGLVLQAHVLSLVEITSASVDRTFLMNVATLIKCVTKSGTATASGTSIAIDVTAVVLPLIQDFDIAGGNDTCGALYILGSALGSVSDAEWSSLSEEHKEKLLSSFRSMTNILAKVIDVASDFVHYPRSEQDQNTRVALTRSALDAIRCVGSLKWCLASDSSEEWMELKIKTISQLQRVIKWDTSPVKADEHLASRLAALRRIAVQAFGRSVAGLPGSVQSKYPNASSDLFDSALKNASNALVASSKNVADPEFQFDVGEAFVALGTHDSDEKFEVEDAAVEERSFNANRAAAVLSLVISESMESKQKLVRRNAVVWLLCICVAGLRSSQSPSTTEEADHLVNTSSSWHCVLSSPSFAAAVFKVHEFFVTMLNDENDIAKESAVKGLAYLRLRAPNDWMGMQFSDSLFRRLRCFRAFVTPSSTANAMDEANDADSDASAMPTGGAAPLAPSSSESESTVENAAYREVSNLAADIGDPDLMYGLLYLSTSDPLWDSFEIPVDVSSQGDKLSGAFSFALADRTFRTALIAQAGSSWMASDTVQPNPRAQKLLPWLFLLKFHSNSKVSSLMASLWKVFAQDAADGALSKAGADSPDAGKSVVKQHWDTIFQFVLGRLENSRNFKYREAACGALTDILNGAEAKDVRASFARLWKTASRAVDDVMEAVALAGVKLYRYLGEMSLRVAGVDDECRTLLLDFLIRDGIVAKNVICRTLSIDILLRLMKGLEARALEDRLATLIPNLLEYLSSLEMPELQYAQFHVEKKDQLERLRVSISQSGPVGQLLELSTTRLKELAGSEKCVAIIEELARSLGNLLKFGVGLNTRVGTANFVATLAVELPFEVRKSKAADSLLQKVLQPYVGAKTSEENELYGDDASRYAGEGSLGGLSDGLVVQAYCRAAAYLSPLAEPSAVKNYVRNGIFARSRVPWRSPSPNGASGAVESPPNDVAVNDDVYVSRFLLISALATKELVAKMPPVADTSTLVGEDGRNHWYCANVFPAAFIGHFSSTEVLKQTWQAVFDELPPSVLYAKESLDAVLEAIAQLIAQPAWDSRKQGVLALRGLFASTTYRAKISAEQANRIRTDLWQAVPGRLWKGKGAILEALVALAEASSMESESDWSDLSTLLLDESSRAWKNHDLEYLESAITSVGTLSPLIPVPQHGHLRVANFLTLRRIFGEWLTDGKDNEQAATLPPLLIKCVFEALRLAWPPLSSYSETKQEDPNAQSYLLQSVDVLEWLLSTVTSPQFNVWSVRKSVFLTLSAVVASVPPLAFGTGSTTRIARLVDRCCGDFGVGDGKYAMVRVAAATALVSLLKRANLVDAQDIALQVTVERERVAVALQVLQSSEDSSEQQAAFDLRAALGALS